MLKTTPNLKTLKTEFISSIELLFLLLAWEGLAEKVGSCFAVKGLNFVAILTFPRRVLVCFQSVQPPG